MAVSYLLQQFNNASPESIQYVVTRIYHVMQSPESKQVVESPEYRDDIQVSKQVDAPNIVNKIETFICQYIICSNKLMGNLLSLSLS